MRLIRLSMYVSLCASFLLFYFSVFFYTMFNVMVNKDEYVINFNTVNLFL